MVLGLAARFSDWGFQQFVAMQVLPGGTPESSLLSSICSNCPNSSSYQIICSPCCLARSWTGVEPGLHLAYNECFHLRVAHRRKPACPGEMQFIQALCTLVTRIWPYRHQTSNVGDKLRVVINRQDKDNNYYRWKKRLEKIIQGSNIEGMGCKL